MQVSPYAFSLASMIVSTANQFACSSSQYDLEQMDRLATELVQSLGGNTLSYASLPAGQRVLYLIALSLLANPANPY